MFWPLLSHRWEAVAGLNSCATVSLEECSGLAQPCTSLFLTLKSSQSRQPFAGPAGDLLLLTARDHDAAAGLNTGATVFPPPEECSGLAQYLHLILPHSEILS
jgi:hypothetical protein